jgi:hypothetical protein
LFNWLIVNTKSVFRPILFLGCKDPLVEKLCVLTSIEGIVLEILASASLRLFYDGVKLIFIVYSGIIIVFICAQYWISGVDSQTILGYGIVCSMCQTSPEIWSITVLENLRMVYKSRIISCNVYLIQIDFFIDYVDSRR